MSAKTTRFERLLEAVPDALVGMDQKGVIRFVNRQTESLFGYDRDQLIGQRIETLVPEYLWQIYTTHQHDYFADPRTRSSGVEVELSGRRGDGAEFPINISLSHIDTGDVLLVITAVSDVTRQRQAVKDAQLTRAIVEYSDDAIIGTTLHGKVTTWNPAAERMYGYSSREIIGRPVSLLSPKDRTGEAKAALARIIAGEAVEHLETYRVRKDQTVVPVSITIAAIHDEDGAIIGASAVHRDVTQQRQALAVAQQLAAIVESSDDAIIGRMLDGTITSWNAAAERMFGYSSGEIIGKPIDLLIPQDRVGEMRGLLAKTRTGQPVEHLETMRLRKDQTEVPVSLTISPIRDADGVIVGTSAIARDVTTQREAFVAAQRMAAIVEHSDDAIIGCTLEGTITSWNPAAGRMYGYPRDRIAGRSVDLLSPQDRTGEIKAILARIGEGRPDNIETICTREDQSTFPVKLTVAPIRDSDGAVVGASVIARDRTKGR